MKSMQITSDLNILKFILVILCVVSLIAALETAVRAQRRGTGAGPERQGPKVDKGLRPEFNGLDQRQKEEIRRKLHFPDNTLINRDNGEENYYNFRDAADRSYESGNLEAALENYVKALDYFYALEERPRRDINLNQHSLNWKIPHASSFRKRILTIVGAQAAQAEAAYSTNNWSECTGKYEEAIYALFLIKTLDSKVTTVWSSVDPIPKRIEIYSLRLGDLYSRWCQEDYERALQDGSWQNARRASETAKISKYINDPGKGEAEEYIRRIGNHEAVTKMPLGSSVLDVLNEGSKLKLQITTRIGEKSTEVTPEIDSVESLANLRALQDSRRILLTRAASEKLAPQINLAKKFPDKVVWRDPDINEASTAISELSSEHLTSEDFAAAIMLPRNMEQRELLGLQWAKNQVEAVWNSSRYFLKQSRIKDVITSRVNRGGFLGYAFEKLGITRVRENLFEALKTRKGVVIVFSHGDRRQLYLPDGETLSAEEVSKLDLSKNRPLVLLLSCEGGKLGENSDASLSFEGAFKKAGAKAVMTFEQKVDASVANIIAGKLFDRINSNEKISILDAIEETVKEIQAPGQEEFPTPRFKVQMENDMNRKGKSIGLG